MKKQNLSEQEVVSLYKESNEKGKAILEKKYGKKMFTKPEHDYKIITTLAAVFKITKPDRNEKILLDYNGINDRLLGAQAALMLFHAVEAINGGTEHNWEDPNTYKYANVFNMKPGGGFSRSYYVDWLSRSDVGSRLSLIDIPRAEHLAKYFPKQYKLLMQKKHER